MRCEWVQAYDGTSYGTKEAQRSVHKIPDMIILKPNAEYHGLILELKSEDSSPYLKDGSLSKGQHIQEQNQTLTTLLNIGYYAIFAVGFDNAKKIIDDYIAIYN